MKIAHVINPVDAKPPSDLITAQPITFESMRIARKFAKNKKIEQWACFYPEDEHIVPDYFKKLPCLQHDISNFKKFGIRRKLPLFREMLDLVVDASDADYIVQTNADIALMPHFYKLIYELIGKGHEAFIINKRVIPAYYSKVSELPEMYCELGGAHNGSDCFVFPSHMYGKFELGDICMGTPWSEATLTMNMAEYCELTTFRNMHATFHIGDSRTWLSPKLNDYRLFNTNEFARVLKKHPKAQRQPAIRWLLWKMKHELSPHHSQDCHDLCNQTAGMM